MIGPQGDRMSTKLLGPPTPSEYDPHFGAYVALVPETDYLAALASQLDAGLRLLRSVPPGKADHRYAPGKWSVKEVVGHVTDAERVFAYRALAFARGERAPLPGFDENAWAREARFGRLPLEALVAEYESVRRSTMHLFAHLDPEAWTRIGTANGVAISVRALAYVIVGHDRHHAGVLAERYLA